MITGRVEKIRSNIIAKLKYLKYKNKPNFLYGKYFNIIKSFSILHLFLKLSIPGISCHLMIGRLWEFIRVDKGYMNFIVRKHITIVNLLIIMLGYIPNCLKKYVPWQNLYTLKIKLKILLIKLK